MDVEWKWERQVSRAFLCLPLLSLLLYVLVCPEPVLSLVHLVMTKFIIKYIFWKQHQGEIFEAFSWSPSTLPTESNWLSFMVHSYNRLILLLQLGNQIEGPSLSTKTWLNIHVKCGCVLGGGGEWCQDLKWDEDCPSELDVLSFIKVIKDREYYILVRWCSQRSTYKKSGLINIMGLRGPVINVKKGNTGTIFYQHTWHT